MSDALDRLAALRIVPVLTVENAEEAERACDALLSAGLPAVEITFRTDAAADAIRRVAGADELLVGAGTVLTTDQLERALDSGARFAVAPGTDPAVVDSARERGIPFVPGIATPSEIERAMALGCETLKVFPASLLGGPAFVTAVTSVYPDVRFLPTGGINPDNLASYLGLSSVLACAGTWICERALLRERRFGEVERRAREAVGLAAVALPV